MSKAAAAQLLRTQKALICANWQRAIEDQVPELKSLARAALIDHLPELIDALAAWVEGDTRAARLGFDALADGHAVQRLGYGIDLRTLTREYQILRHVVLREALEADPDQEIILRLNEGLDEALFESVRRYAENRDQTRDHFINVLAHDLRNPLNAVTIAAATLRVAPNSPTDVAEVARIVDTSATRMQQLINDLLELARNQLGSGIPLVLKKEDVGEMVAVAVREIEVAHPNRTLKLEVQGNLDGMFDRERFLQAISNLVANAVEHGQDPIEVDASEADDGRAILTSVRNRGEKLTTDELQALLDPMRRQVSARGLGLGLRIVSSIALAHGATVTTSSADATTTFTIRWPRVLARELPDDPRQG
ncbi:MAG: HAMP domain-containing sensor histidine kinase [Kofleriaceae bacterium]